MAGPNAGPPGDTNGRASRGGMELGGHHSAARILVGLTIGVLLGGCASSAVTPPVATPPPTALPASAATHTASPVPTTNSTLTPEPPSTPTPVSGWPTVSRARITMTGTVEGPEDAGRLRLSITVSGLAPGEAVSLSATGDYIVTWVCGVDPEQCGDAGCAPAFSGA